MKAITAIGHVSCAEILTGGNQVIDTHRKERTKRDLKWASLKINVIVARGRRVQVDRVAPNSDGIRKLRRAHLLLGNAGTLRNCAQSHVLFEDGELSADATRLADVRIFRDTGRTSE